jgi:hypothetical protein
MSNPDILGKVDKVLRPVLKELHRFSWIRVEGCCAGHKPEDSLWMEVSVLGASGLRRLSEFLQILDSKVAGTEIRLDCIFIYSAGGPEEPVPHGWIYLTVEVFWPARPEWRRSQSMVIESMMSSIEELSSKITEPEDPGCAINYCPFCSSSLVRIDNIGTAGHRYKCGDCDMKWTMIDPVI